MRELQASIHDSKVAHHSIVIIQAACRRYLAIRRSRTLLEHHLHGQKLSRAAKLIQRIYRGHKGRDRAEIERALKQAALQVRPLLMHLEEMQRNGAALESAVVRHEAAVEELYAVIADIERELEFCDKTTAAFVDSARINGIPQRFPTAYLKIRLESSLVQEQVNDKYTALRL